MSTDHNWLPIARLMRPQGRRGELLAELLTDLRSLFTDDRDVFLTPEGPPLKLESHFFPTGRNAGRIVLKLSSANSISEAETLQGQTLHVPASELPELDPDTFLVRDLLGCELLDCAHPGHPQAVGEVVDVEFPTGPNGARLEDAATLLVVQTHEPTEVDDGTTLIPFIRAWLLSVDTAARQIRMNLPPGLIDDTDDDAPKLDSPELDTPEPDA